MHYSCYLLIYFSFFLNIFPYITNKIFFIYFSYNRYAVVGWHDIIEAERISLGDDCFLNWSRTTSKLLVTKLQQTEMLE
ncbi:hypothetical protein Hanom_Chr16g01501581 [Helianthus anomalus]